MKAFCQSILEKKMYYGPLLGWAYVMGKDIAYAKNLGYVSPAGMTFVGENSDYVMVGTDGLEAIKALRKDFQLEIAQSPKPLTRVDEVGDFETDGLPLQDPNSPTKGPQHAIGPLQEDYREDQACQRAQQGHGLCPTPGIQPSRPS